MYFDELYLNDNILDALDDMHFETCTPIQEKCIPEILDGRDLIGIAQTGTGKTAAYLLPILSLLDDGLYPKDANNCVIMAPTRELAQQIDQAMQGFGYYLQDVSSVAVYGGNDGNRYDQELKGLKMGADVIIATPGRLISHITMGNVDFSRVSFFVLDEADRMLDMGFCDDILKIASQLPKNCQTIMFSATMPPKIEQLAKTLLKNPAEVKLAVSKPADNIRQGAYVCHENQKLRILKHMFTLNEPHRVIVFSGSKLKVRDITRDLLRMHINCGEMHSDLDQSQRDDIMYRFKSGQIDVLVATDIVARGIDIDDIEMVINYDVPHDAEDYVHRIGRTARANKDGVAVTLVRGREIGSFMQIEKFLERSVDKLPLPEGIGEGPEYKPQPGGKSFGRGGKRFGSRGGNKRRNGAGNRNNSQGRKKNGQGRGNKHDPKRRNKQGQAGGNKPKY
ncbi:MAG: DEAD/DEAH box helicase [Prevotella sp.]|nr:DEAD/DEAH box helicase [Prevotella sp.]